MQFIAQYSNDHDTTVNVLKQAFTIQLKRIRLYEQLKMINTLIRENVYFYHYMYEYAVT